MTHVRHVGCALILLLGCTTAAFAQGRADIVGRVTDASGGVLPAVTVSAENMATNIVSTTTSSETGDYLFAALPIGTYTVKIELDGFQTKSTRVTLTTGDRVRVDATLELGTLSESVLVTGQSPLLQTDTSRVASLINEKLVQDAPIQGRNIVNFIQLTPGASEGQANAKTSGNRPDDRRQTSAVSIMGAAENENSQLIDGMDNTERVQGGMGIKPSIDVIAEVLVQTNNYSAENGRTLGGVINIITKSGGNRFHGSAFEFTPHERFDARHFFATEKALNRLHQFGASLGGPIRTNKTFFFVDYDQSRIRKGVSSVVTVPTMKMRTGDFSEILPTVIYDPLTTPRTPFPGNIVPPGRLDALALKLFALYPAPTSPGLANNFSMTNLSWQTNHTTDMRIDHRFSENDSIFARYSYNKTTGLTPSMCPVAEFQGRKIDPTCNTQGTQGIYSGPYLSYAHNAIGSWVHIFNSTLISEVKFNFVRPLTTAGRPSANDPDLARFLGMQNINYPGSDPITGGLSWFEPRPLVYAAIGDPTFIPMTTENHTYQFAGSVTKTRGAHTFKIGGGLVYRQFAVQQSQSPRSMFAFDVAPTRSSTGAGGDTWASWLLGYPSLMQRIHFPIHSENRTHEPSVYLQDDWRATSWLTINLGVRYEIFTPTTEVEDRMSAFNVDAGRILVAGRDTTRTGGVRTDYSDIGPRVGFAATLPRRMVLRSGFGMTYSPVLRGAGSFLKNPPFTQNFGPFTSAASSGGRPDLFLQTPVPPLVWNDEMQFGIKYLF